MRMYMDSLVEKQTEMVVADPDNTGFITLFRVYPKGVDAKEQFARELNDKNYRAELLESNRFQQAVGEKMFQWYMDGHKINGKYVPHITNSTSSDHLSPNQVTTLRIGQFSIRGLDRHSFISIL